MIIFLNEWSPDAGKIVWIAAMKEVFNYFQWLGHRSGNLLVVDTMWMPDSSVVLKMIRDLSATIKIDRVLITSVVDGDHHDIVTLVTELSKIVPEVKLLGNFEHFYPESGNIEILQYKLMPLIMDSIFPKYTTEELTNKTGFSHKYICYFGKPREYRIQFWEKMKHLESEGITFFRGYSNILENNMAHRMEGSEQDEFGSCSLGNLDYWTKSFLCVVLESNHQYGVDSNVNSEFPFTSEKIFKPILGMKPFVSLAGNGTIGWLHRNGFETFNDYFGFPKEKDLSIDEVVSILENLKLSDCQAMYKDMYPKLLHNRNRFFEYCKEVKRNLFLDLTPIESILK